MLPLSCQKLIIVPATSSQLVSVPKPSQMHRMSRHLSLVVAPSAQKLTIVAGTFSQLVDAQYVTASIACGSSFLSETNHCCWHLFSAGRRTVCHGIYRLW
jgi:hypothetical protein